jgi:hypothetical protein
VVHSHWFRISVPGSCAVTKDKWVSNLEPPVQKSCRILHVMLKVKADFLGALEANDSLLQLAVPLNLSEWSISHSIAVDRERSTGQLWCVKTKGHRELCASIYSNPQLHPSVIIRRRHPKSRNAKKEKPEFLYEVIYQQ